MLGQKRWVLLLTFFLVAVAGLALGVLSGRFYRQVQSDAAAQGYRRELQAGLEESLDGIEVGSPFPDIPFKSTKNDIAVLSRDYLPRGGIILYFVANCGTCLETVQALHRAAEASERGFERILIIVQGDTESVASYMAHEGIDLRVVADSDRILMEHYGVVIYPCFFGVDRNHIVRTIVADPRDDSEFLSALKSMNGWLPERP